MFTSVLRVTVALVMALGAMMALYAPSPARAADLTVTQSQQALRGLYYYDGAIDGIAGNDTHRGTAAFQTHNCLEVDGDVQGETATALVAKVTLVQDKVGVETDGDYDSVTSKAVADWQRDHGLSADGLAGPATMEAMGITRAECGTHELGASISRDTVLERAALWVDAPVPYSMSLYEWDSNQRNYRTDCSGFVSLAWHLSTSRTTATLPDVSTSIEKDELEPGDIMNVKAGVNGRDVGHVRMFIGWTDSSKTDMVMWEQTPSQTRQATYNYAAMYDEGYRALRYDKITD